MFYTSVRLLLAIIVNALSLDEISRKNGKSFGVLGLVSKVNVTAFQKQHILKVLMKVCNLHSLLSTCFQSEKHSEKPKKIKMFL